MSNLLINKVAAITGGSSGIGRAIALELARNGAKVVINYYPNDLETERAKSLGQEIEEVFANDSTSDLHFGSVAGDIGDPATGKALISETVKLFGKLDIFVSNAGICPFHEFTSMPEEVYYRTIKTNLDGAFFSTQAAAKQMKEQGTGGSIIGISSISALVGGEFQTHYTTTKAGVLSLMQSTAVALGKYGIRCNAILPGTIATDINKDDLKDQEKRDYFNKRIPLGRLGEPSDLGGPAVFLASDLSKYVTGAQILVDGGLFVNLQ